MGEAWDGPSHVAWEGRENQAIIGFDGSASNAPDAIWYRSRTTFIVQSHSVTPNRPFLRQCCSAARRRWRCYDVPTADVSHVTYKKCVNPRLA